MNAIQPVARAACALIVLTAAAGGTGDDRPHRAGAATSAAPRDIESSLKLLLIKQDMYCQITMFNASNEFVEVPREPESVLVKAEDGPWSAAVAIRDGGVRIMSLGPGEGFIKRVKLADKSVEAGVYILTVKMNPAFRTLQPNAQRFRIAKTAIAAPSDNGT